MLYNPTKLVPPSPRLRTPTEASHATRRLLFDVLSDQHQTRCTVPQSEDTSSTPGSVHVAICNPRVHFIRSQRCRTVESGCWNIRTTHGKQAAAPPPPAHHYLLFIFRVPALAAAAPNHRPDLFWACAAASRLFAAAAGRSSVFPLHHALHRVHP